jgi:hypothetical protein
MRPQAGVTGPTGLAEHRLWRLRPVAIAVLAVATQLLVPAGASASARHANFDVPPYPNGPASGKVSCPAGERATGGGYIASALGADMAIGASRKVGQSSWRATVASFSGGTDTATVYVYCSSQAPQTTEVANTKPLGANGETLVGASCDGFGTAQAGGFSTAPKKGIVVTSFRYGNLWRVRGRAVVGSTPSATSYAYCAKASKPIARPGEPAPGTETEYKTAQSASCEGGAAPLAGGFRQPDFTTAGGGFQTPTVLRRVNGRWRAKALHQQNTSSFVSIAYCP